MHRCLYISEIVAHIAENALEVESDSESIPARDWHTVAALARTCKTVHDPASEILWRDQVELINLIKCLPKEAWEERNIEPVGPDGWSRKLFFTRPIEPSDLQGIQHIATRIRSLYFLSAALTKWRNKTLNRTTHGMPFITAVLSREALEELGHCHPMLMPKLRILWLGDQYREEIFQSPILFSPTMRTVTMTALDPQEVDSNNAEETRVDLLLPEMWQGQFSSALKHARNICPDIVRLHMIAQEGLASIPIEFPALDEALSDFVRLQNLTLQGIVPPFSAFSRMSLFQGLKELQIGASESTTLAHGTIDAHTRMNQKSLLPSLDGLYITADSDLSIIPVVAYHCMPVLKEFLASAWFEAPEMLLQALYDHLDHNQLNSLHLDNLQDFDPEYEDLEVLTGAMITPLLVFRNLNMLFIHGCIMGLCDDDMHKMAKAWPALERLSMCSELDVAPCGVTLLGLRHLVEHCPRLRVLEITFNLEEGKLDESSNGANADTTQEIKHRGARNWNVTRIHVGASAPPGMPHHVAAKRLAGLFPRLRTLDGFKDCGHPDWKMIEKYLPKNRQRMLLHHERLENCFGVVGFHSEFEA